MIAEWVDTHCHLDALEFADDRDIVVRASQTLGVCEWFVPAVEASGFASLQALSRRYEGVRAAYGIHPLYVDEASEADLDALATALTHDPSALVGEIGLDGFVSTGNMERQRWFFEAQLELAARFGRPVLLHVRHAVEAVWQILRRHPSITGIAHAFNGSRQQADLLIGRGFMLGFGGALTYAGSRRIRQLAATLPLSALVLETDAPDMAPVWLDGGRNSPAELPRIGQVLAELRQTTPAAIAKACRENAHRVRANT